MARQATQHGTKTFIATSAITAHRRVELTSSSGTAVEHAAAGDNSIGVALHDAAAGDQVAVRLFNAPGTVIIEAHEAFAVGATCYGAAAGRFGDTDPTSTTERYVALEAATAQGDLIEAIRTVK